MMNGIWMNGIWMNEWMKWIRGRMILSSQIQFGHYGFWIIGGMFRPITSVLRCAWSWLFAWKATNKGRKKIIWMCCLKFWVICISCYNLHSNPPLSCLSHEKKKNLKRKVGQHWATLPFHSLHPQPTTCCIQRPYKLPKGFKK